MHELGILAAVAEEVEEVAAENHVTKIQKLVLQVGELSTMVPRYMENLYGAAVDGTVLEGSELEIEVIPGNGKCKECDTIYNLLKHEGYCPTCGKKDFEVLSGQEFMIKEIVCY